MLPQAPSSEHESHCYILQIPPEIRQEIYQYLYGNPSVVNLCVLDGIFVEYWDDESPPTSPSLLRVCKTLHSEAAPIFWNNIMFSMDIEPGMRRMMTGVAAKKLAPIEECSFLRLAKRAEVLFWGFRRNLESMPDRLRRLLEMLDFGRRLTHFTIEFETSPCSGHGLEMVQLLAEGDCEGEIVVQLSSGNIAYDPDKDSSTEQLASLAKVIGG